MLMSALTSTLDISNRLGELAGHAVRICDLLRAVRSVAQAPHSRPLPPRACDTQASAGTLETRSGRTTRWRLPGRRNKRIDSPRLLTPLATPIGGAAQTSAVTSAFGLVLPKDYRSQAVTLQWPTSVRLRNEQRAMQVSVHSTGRAELRSAIASVFPDAPSDAPLLCVCTFQPMASGCWTHLPSIAASSQVRLATLSAFALFAFRAGPPTQTRIIVARVL